MGHPTRVNTTDYSPTRILRRPHGPPGRAAPSNVKIPQPEKATIGEEYAKGSIVIVNHERNLYFVEEPGQATRYPVAIGSPVDQWEGVQTITAKRENPTWYPPEDIQWESNVPPVVPPGPPNPRGPHGSKQTRLDRRRRLARPFSHAQPAHRRAVRKSADR